MGVKTSASGGSSGGSTSSTTIGTNGGTTAAAASATTGSGSGTSGSGSASSSGSTTGVPLPTCEHTGQTLEFFPCEVDDQCACPLVCLPNGGSSSNLCQQLCKTGADCTAAQQCTLGVTAQGDAGVCELTTLCSVYAGAAPQGAACARNIDCACPRQCIDVAAALVDAGLDAGPNPGPPLQCRLACQSQADCAPTGEQCVQGFCEGQGRCILPDAGRDPDSGVNRYDAGGRDQDICNFTPDCQCPFDCVYDPTQAGGPSNNGTYCQPPCITDNDCPFFDGGEGCNPSTHHCSPGLTCYNGGPTPPLQGCVLGQPNQCPCPQRCVADLAAGALNPSDGGLGICETCTPDGGNCQTVGGSCRPPDVDAGLLPAEDGTLCTSNADCVCDDRCVLDTSNSSQAGSGGLPFAHCQRAPACHRAADCPDPTTTCNGQVCVPNPCFGSTYKLGGINPIAGLACDVTYGTDQPVTVGDGTCLQGLCTQAGTASGPCDPHADRRHPEQLCPVGQTCQPAADGGFSCVPACDIYAAALAPNACSPGFSCSLPDPNAYTTSGLYLAGSLMGTCRPTPELSAGGRCVTGVSPTTSADNAFQTVGGFGEFAGCLADECSCPLRCTSDGFLFALNNSLPTSYVSHAYCERDCQTSADCGNPLTSCSEVGSTPPVVRACQFGQAAECLTGNEGDVCHTGVDNAVGTCVLRVPFPDIDNALPLLLCRRSGGDGGPCDPEADRCPSGEDCFALADGGAGCGRVCDPWTSTCSNTGCSAEYFTAVYPEGPGGYQNAGEGICLDHRQDAGCWPGHPPNEFSLCYQDLDCSCGLRCTHDPGWIANQYQFTSSEQFCEQPCATSADCLNATEVCLAGFCTANACDPPAVGQLCDAGGSLDGTCLPALEISKAATPYLGPAYLAQAITGGAGLFLLTEGFCHQAGTAVGHCDPLADRAHPELLCGTGQVCGPDASCHRVCDANAAFELLSGAPDGSVPLCGPGQLCRSLPVPGETADNETFLGRAAAFAPGYCVGP